MLEQIQELIDRDDVFDIEDIVDLDDEIDRRERSVEWPWDEIPF